MTSTIRYLIHTIFAIEYVAVGIYLFDFLRNISLGALFAV